MRWLKIAGVCVAVLVALSVVSFALKMIEWLVIAVVLVGIVVLGLKTRDYLRSARNTKIDTRRDREMQAREARVRLSVEKELEQMKREIP
jgi:hypothetical protein